jgi:nucleoside-diphosphate-sugar epimerase/predicted dehydrogenase
MNRPAPIRVLLVGAGAVSQIFYLPLFRVGIDALQLVGIVDPGASWVEADGVPLYRCSFEESFADVALMAGVDAVLVALPHHLHAPCVQGALALGKHVFCEKPLAMTGAELDDIERARGAGGQVLAVCQPRRHFPGAAAIARIVSSGFFGKPVRVAWSEGQPYGWPAASIAQILDRYGGSVLFDIGAHVFDLLSWWLGPLELKACDDDATGGTAAEYALGLQDARGTPVAVRLSRLHPLENRVEIEFERGTLHWELLPTGSVQLVAGDLAEFGKVSIAPEASGVASMIDAIAADLRAFAAAITGESRPSATIEDARLVARVFDQCRERAGKAIAAGNGGEAKYLVTGAGGFIGCALVKALVDRGESVHALVHTPRNSVRLARMDVPISMADIRDPATLEGLMPRDGIVIHAAVSHANPQETVVEGTLNVLRAAAAAKVKRVVVLSSMLAMGEPPASGEVDENSRLAPSAMPYALAKAGMERAAHDFARANGLELVILRPTCVFGPYGSDFGSAHLDAMVSKRHFQVDGGQGRANLVYVDNLVDAILLAANAPEIGGSTFLVNEEEHAVTWGEYFAELAKAAFKRAPEAPSFTREEVADLQREWRRRNSFPGVLRAAVRAHPGAREWLAAKPLFRAWQGLRSVGRTGPAVAAAPVPRPVAVPAADAKVLLREAIVGDRRCYIDEAYAAFFSSRATYSSAQARTRLGWSPRVGRDEAMASTRDWAARAYKGSGGSA